MIDWAELPESPLPEAGIIQRLSPRVQVDPDVAQTLQGGHVREKASRQIECRRSAQTCREPLLCYVPEW